MTDAVVHKSLRMCERELYKKHPNHAQAREGERFTCSCRRVFSHVCDEAEGCYWALEESTVDLATH